MELERDAKTQEIEETVTITGEVRCIDDIAFLLNVPIEEIARDERGLMIWVDGKRIQDIPGVGD